MDLQLMTNLSKQHIATIKDAARKLTRSKKRAFQAQVCIDYLNSKAYLAEKVFGSLVFAGIGNCMITM